MSSGRGSSYGWVLLGVVLVAFGLRLWGLGWQLPYPLYYDELKYVLPATSAAEGLLGEQADYRNPSLFKHLLEVEYRVLPLLGRVGGSPDFYADESLLGTRIFLGRLTVAMLGAASVPLLWVVGKQAAGPRVGLLAAALLAVNLLHVHLSHFSLNDVPAGFFLVAALYPSLGLTQRPSPRRFFLAGLLGGLAAAAKYNFGIVLLAPLAAYGLRVVRRTASARLTFMGPLLLGLGAVLGFVVGMPEVVWSFDEVVAGMARQSNLGSRRWPGQAMDPVLLLYGKALLQAFGLPVLLVALGILAAVGLRFQGRGSMRPGLTPGGGPQDNRRTCPELALLVLAVAPLVYLAFMVSKPLFFARFALPLVPFACLFIAYGVVWLYSELESLQHRRVLAPAVCLALLVPPAMLSARLDLLAGQTDTRVQALEWVRAHVPPGTRFASQIYSLPITLEGDEIRRTHRMTETFGLSDEQRFTQLACQGNRYVLTSSFQEDRGIQAARGREPSGYQALRERGLLVMTFWPGPDDSSVPLNIDDVGLPFWHLTHYTRPGPTIRVYELTPKAC